MLVRLWRKRNPRSQLMGMQIGTATLEISTENPYRARNKSTCGPGLWPVLKTWTSGSTASCSAVLIPALLRMARKWKQCECPSVDELIMNIRYVHTIKYLLFTVKKSGIMTFAGKWMDLGKLH